MKKIIKFSTLMTLLMSVAGCNIFNSNNNSSITSSSTKSSLTNTITNSSSSTSSNNDKSSSSNLNSSSDLNVSSSTSINSSSNSSSSSSISTESKDPVIKDFFENVTFKNWTLWSSDNSMTTSFSNEDKIVSLGLIHSDGTSDNWSFQAKYDQNLYLEQDIKYTASITITSSINRKVEILVQTTSYSFMQSNEVIELVANVPYNYVLNFTCDQEDSYLFGVMMGKVDGSIYKENHNIELSNPSFKYEYKENEEKEEYVDPLDPYASYPQTINVNGKDLNYSWSDEFNGNSLDTSIWTYEIGRGSGGWGNNEYQYYREENTTVNDGYMTITAKKESYNNANYTSSRLISKDKYEFHYGYAEARISLPRGRGIWPAFWMLGANIDEKSWPYCGEIDIMEAINAENKTYSTIHYNNDGSNASYSHAEYGNGGKAIDDRTKFHTYSLYWDETVMIFYVDNVSVHTVSLTPAYLDCFHQDHFFIFNVAVGGNWPGFNIDDSQFPTAMKVDYLRVYK